MAAPVVDSYSCASGGVINAGRYGEDPPVDPGEYVGVIALSAQGAADPFAASPPGQLPTMPNAPVGGTFSCKHQYWTYDSTHGDMVVSGGDSWGNSRSDVFSYTPATRTFAKILRQDEWGAQNLDRSITQFNPTDLIVTNGSGYVNGIYPDAGGATGVPLAGGTGTGATVWIEVIGGAAYIKNHEFGYLVTSGYGYTVGDVLTVNNAHLGGSGSGFSITVTAVSDAGTPSSVVGPIGRCLPGLCHDANRNVIWFEGGTTRPSIWASNAKVGGLWALDRETTPLPTWHRQGPGCQEATGRIADQYSGGLFYDPVGDALYRMCYGKLYKYSLGGIEIDGVSRDNWQEFDQPHGTGGYSYPAYDSRRRRIVHLNGDCSATYAWDCATDTDVLLNDTPFPFSTDVHLAYDSALDRVILWAAADNRLNNAPDWQGARIHWMYWMDPEGNWTQFTPEGDQLIEPDVVYPQFSGAYDGNEKCLVAQTGNQNNAAYDYVSPPRANIYHLYSPSSAAPALNLVGTNWTPNRDASHNVLASDWAALPLNTWVAVVGETLSGVIETPHYLGGFGDSANSITGAWNGAAWDYINQRMYIAGGGHSDSSACETGIYMVDAATAKFSRVRDRDPMSVVQGWDGNAHALVPAEKWTGFNVPLQNGNPSAVHTFNGLVWVPPEVLGNTNGGLFYPGEAKAVWNFDTHAWTATHWFNADSTSYSSANVCAYIDGSKIYGPRGAWYHWRFDLTQTEITQWGASSFGEQNLNIANQDIGMFDTSGAIWNWMRERREEFCIISSTARTRTKYGLALDAGATNWTPYSDAITLTSSDGSHAYFGDDNNYDLNPADPQPDESLAQPGMAYDHATETLYIQANKPGDFLYKITGLSGSTWTVQRISGTGALYWSKHGNYGRMRLATLGGKKILLRVTHRDDPLQVMRIS